MAASDGNSLETLETTTDEELDFTFEPIVYDAETVVDSAPSAVFDAQEKDPDWPEADRRELRQFARTANGLRGDADAKLLKLVDVVSSLFRDGYQPIIGVASLPQRIIWKKSFAPVSLI